MRQDLKSKMWMFGIKDYGSVVAILQLLAWLHFSFILHQPLAGSNLMCPPSEMRQGTSLCFRVFTEHRPIVSASKQHPAACTEKSLDISVHAHEDDDEEAAQWHSAAHQGSTIKAQLSPSSTDLLQDSSRKRLCHHLTTKHP